MKSTFIERKKFILEQLEAKSLVDTAEIAGILRVSKETLRKDLAALEKEGLLTRTHGGAVKAENNTPLFERTVYRKNLYTEEKASICKKAASLIQSGDTIFIDCSTTSFSLLKYIDPGKNVTVLTNSIQVVMENEEYLHPNITLIMIGGIFQKDFYSFGGEFASDMLNNFLPNKTFISAMSLGEDGVLYDANMHNIDVKRYFINNSDKVILLIDHSKIGVRGGVQLSPISSVDTVVVDSHVSDSKLETLKSLVDHVVISE
ncbi:MAG: DeoR/GlpR family DNA-binding transcription regulator [Lachnospiraceae bacterium]|nr:DeoR/GlpR family DNA-binding transcription regulator [Lachnospiraceae bacterium]